MNRRNIIVVSSAVCLIRPARHIDISRYFALYIRSFTLYNTRSADSFHFFRNFYEKSFWGPLSHGLRPKQLLLVVNLSGASRQLP